MKIKTYSIEEQEKLILLTWPQAHNRLAAKLNRKGEEMFSLGIERMKKLGYEQYGDSSFHLPLAIVDIEVEAELADALVWEGIYHLKSEGIIP